MNFFKTKIRQFAHEDDGAFALIFAVISIVLIATGGSAVDFVSIQQNRSTAQISMDAAVLALQPEIYTKSPSQIKTLAEAMLLESINNSDITILLRTPVVDTEAGTLLLTADISRPTVFVKLVGVDRMRATIISEATRAKNLLEVAMVLDNSGSMRGSRIANLQSAANLAVDILSGGDNRPDKVFIGLVPFNQYVNLGNGGRNSKGIDVRGRSSISWDNFDDDHDPATGHNPNQSSDRLDRLALYDELTNDEWKGCVEARPHDSSKPIAERLDVNDEIPVNRDGDTLFVPVFEPDLPDWEDRWGNYDGQRGYLRDYQTSCSWNNGHSDRVRQERVCKYTNRSVSFGRSSENGDGPNAGCGDAEVLPLTNRMTRVKNAINAMVADGGTNIHMGTIWGWRVLSPTKPYTQGAEYDAGSSKVMIIMTDGQNYASQSNTLNGAYYYSAYGWPYNERLGRVGWSNSQMITEMDNRTKMSCTNAKAAGIEVYTIGLGISSGSTNGRMLTDCATSSSHDFFPSSPSDLNATFKKIADQLSDLRISR